MDHNGEGIPAAANPEGRTIGSQINGNPNRNRRQEQQQCHQDMTQAPLNTDMSQSHSNDPAAYHNIADPIHTDTRCYDLKYNRNRTNQIPVELPHINQPEHSPGSFEEQ
ncbi:hypothetical protein D3C72_2006340 [compost metagenome]